MNWFLLSLLCAFFAATADAFSKKSLTESNEYLIAWVRVGFSVPFFLVLLPFIEIPPLDKTFFFAVFTLIPLEITALILYVRAIKISPLSLTLPFLALTPIFMIGTSHLILGERLNRNGMIGIFLTTVGAYLLNVKTTQRGIFEPFKAIRRERGSLYMIIVAFIYSIASNLGKMAVLHSSPLFFVSTYYVFLAGVMLPLLLWKSKGGARQLFSHSTIFILIGLTMAISHFTHFLGISTVEAPYFISVKRTSLLFGVLYGAFWFRERDIKERLFGTLLMIAGVVVITLL